MKKAKTREKFNILFVGDWIIDEDWVMTDIRSKTSSLQPNEKHFHTAFDHPDVATNGLCGISLTASAIRGYFNNPSTKSKGNVYGIGLWHPDDNKMIEQLFQADLLKDVNPFRISTAGQTGRRKKLMLHNLAREGDICCTTKVVRTFIGFPGSLPQPMSRYDWHLDWKPMDNGKKIKKNDAIHPRLSKIFEDLKDIYFDAIVIADFNKGLITKELLIPLTTFIKRERKDKEIFWFYRTKKVENPEWIQDFSDKLGTNDKFIQIIGPKVSSNLSEGKNLIVGSALTGDGVKFLDDNKPEYISQYKIACLLSNNKCIAFDSETEDKKYG